MNIKNIIDTTEEIIARVEAYTDETGEIHNISVTRGKFYHYDKEIDIKMFVEIYKKKFPRNMNYMVVATIKPNGVESFIGAIN